MIGQSRFRTAPYYRNKGFDVHFDFGKNIAQEDLERVSSIGHWINQNYIIRLCALLEANSIIPSQGKGKIDQSIEGWKEIELLRRLRHQFAHSSGKYNYEDREEKKLYETLVSHFNIVLAQNPTEATEFPIPIDVVLEPLTEGCKKYIKNYLS